MPLRREGTKRCETCGNYFLPASNQGAGAQRYCGYKCRRAAAYKKAQRSAGFETEHGMSGLDLSIAMLDPSIMFVWRGLEPDDWQREELRDWGAGNHNLGVVSSRRRGKTTIAAALLAHKLCFQPDFQAWVAGPTENHGQEALREVVAFINAVPSSLKPEIKNESRGRIETVTGARIVAATGNPSSLRSLGADIGVIDEASFVSDELWVAAQPTLLQRKGRIIAVSTPSPGDSLLRRIFEAEEGRGAAVGWKRRFVSPQDSDRFDMNEIQRLKSTMTQDAFQREYLGLWEAEAAGDEQALDLFTLLDNDHDGADALSTAFAGLVARKGFRYE